MKDFTKPGLHMCKHVLYVSLKRVKEVKANTTVIHSLQFALFLLALLIGSFHFRWQLTQY